jgi:HEAT repeat protein
MRLALSALLGLLFVCAAGVGQDTKKKDDPTKETEINEIAGKNLSQWIEEIHTSDPSKREHAMRMVIGFGQAKSQKAAPAIIEELKKHKPSTGSSIDLSVRIAGTVALGTILTYVEADPKQSANIKVPDHEQVKKAVELFKGLCKDEQVIVRTRAVQALARVGPEALSALDEVIHVAEDKATWEARQAGLQTLMILALVKEKQLEREKPPLPLPDKILSTFYKRLDDNSMQVRITAAQSLAQFTLPPKSNQHAVLLKNLTKVTTKDAEPAVRIMGHLALMTIKLKTDGNKKVDPDHLAAVAKMLDNADPSVRIQAAQALAMIGPLALPVSKNLIGKLLDDKEDTNVVGSCIVALVQMEATEAVPVLERMAKDPKQPEAIKQAAVDACDAIKNPAKKLDKKDKSDSKDKSTTK